MVVTLILTILMGCSRSPLRFLFDSIGFNRLVFDVIEFYTF